MSQDDFSNEEEFEAQWAKARRRAGVPNPNDPGPTRDLYVYPIVTLYAGLFFGPLGTALTAMHVNRWRIVPHHAVALLAGGSATWMLSTGVTMFMTDMDPFEIQLARSGINFVFAASAWWVQRRSLRETHVPTRATVQRTVLTALALVVLFFVMGPTLLMTLGR